METKATKTLNEIDGSLSPEGAQPKTLTLDDGSGPLGLGPAVQAQENGARVSANVDGGVVETEILGKKSFLGSNGSVVGGDGGFNGDAKEIGGLSSSEMEREDKVENGSQAVKGGLTNGDSILVIGDGSDEKMELDRNVSVNLDGKNCGYGNDKGSPAENGENPGGEFMEISGGEGNKNHAANRHGDEEAEDGEEDEGEDGEDTGDEEHKYLVGDFVWGKIRSHPWWPGRIYDPSDASEYAKKYSQGEKLLVAYFGDGSFSWCSPSQLKPFAEDYEEMANQSNSKSFVNAVQYALDEIGKLVELKTTCSCISEENRIGVERYNAMNAGIKKGVLVPECDLSRILMPQFGPEELLSTLRFMAEVVSVTNMLEFTVLRSWLLAFYRAKGGHKLPVYYAPMLIEGLEDKNRNGEMDVNDFSGPGKVPFEGPFEEDWVSSPVSGQTNQPLLQKCAGISEDKLYERRKKKSVAELMEEDMVVELDNEKETVVNVLIAPGEALSISGKKKGKRSGEDISQVGSNLTSPSGRKRGRGKRAETIGSAKSKEKEVLSAKNGDGAVEKEEDKEEKDADSGEVVPTSGKKKRKSSDLASPSSGRKRERGKRAETMGSAKSKEKEVPSAKNGSDEEGEKGSALRKRKKSKYLSPPFTSLKSGARNLSSEKNLEAESEKIARVARVGERMARAAGQLIISPPIVNCSDETKADKSAISSPNPRSEDQKKLIDSVETNADTKEVVSEVRSAALNPLCLREKNSLAMFIGFISAFRSGIYLNGSNYKIYHRRRPGRKRKSPGSDHERSVSKTQRTRNKENEEENSSLKKLKQVDGESQKKKKKKVEKKKDEEGSMLVSLFVTFPPGFSLPSKNDLIAVFSKFGALDEKETEVFYNSNCARVVFLNGSDAKEAFDASLKKNPFGPTKVSYRLRYPPTDTKAREGKEEAASFPKEGGETPAKPADDSNPVAVDEASRVLFTVKKKLEMMTSVMEKSGGKMPPEVQSSLEVEMKGLLEEVSAVAKSTSA